MSRRSQTFVPISAPGEGPAFRTVFMCSAPFIRALVLEQLPSLLGGLGADSAIQSGWNCWEVLRMSSLENEARKIILHCGGVVAGLLRVGHSTGFGILACIEQDGSVHYRRRGNIRYKDIDQLLCLRNRPRARSGTGRGKLGFRYGQQRQQEGRPLRVEHTGCEEVSAQEHSVRK